MITIGCPQCKASYKVDATKIPATGGVITCRSCHTKIPLKQEVAEFEEIEELSADAEVTEDQQTASRISPFLTEAPSPAAPTSPATPKVEPVPAPVQPAAVTLSPAAPPAPAADPAAASHYRRASGPLNPDEALAAPELKMNISPEPKAAPAKTAASAKPAAEVAPGSSLYECPHCHKPFYIKEAKKLAAKKATDAGAEKDTRKAILVVDDQEFFRTFTRDLLGRAYRVMEADTVAAAREHIAECDLLILDLNLAGEDGRLLLADKPARAKCLIFCGQDDNLIDPAAFKQLKAEGADDMLFKSIAASDELKHKVAALLGDLAPEKPSLD